MNSMRLLKRCKRKRLWHSSEWNWLNGKFKSNYRTIQLHRYRNANDYFIDGETNISNVFCSILARKKRKWREVILAFVWECEHILCVTNIRNVDECTIQRIFHLLDSKISIVRSKSFRPTSTCIDLFAQQFYRMTREKKSVAHIFAVAQ